MHTCVLWGFYLCRKCGQIDSSEGLGSPLLHREQLHNSPVNSHIVTVTFTVPISIHNNCEKLICLLLLVDIISYFTLDRYLGMSSVIRLSVAALTSEGLMTTQFPNQRHQQQAACKGTWSHSSYIFMFIKSFKVDSRTRCHICKFCQLTLKLSLLLLEILPSWVPLCLWTVSHPFISSHLNYWTSKHP